MKEKVLVFYVQGSGKNPYRVAFWKEENSRDIHSGCGCPAGKKMMYCKHRFQLIEGDLTNLNTEMSENYEENLNTLYSWLQDSDIGDFFTEFIMAKTGEKIKTIANKYSFDFNENLNYFEINLEEFLEKIESNIFIIGQYQKKHLFDIDSNYFGTYIGDKISFEKYGLKELPYKHYISTKSEYLISCFDIYLDSDIPAMNKKMKEIMK